MKSEGPKARNSESRKRLLEEVEIGRGFPCGNCLPGQILLCSRICPEPAIQNREKRTEIARVFEESGWFEDFYIYLLVESANEKLASFAALPASFLLVLPAQRKLATRPR